MFDSNPLKSKCLVRGLAALAREASRQPAAVHPQLKGFITNEASIVFVRILRQIKGFLTREAPAITVKGTLYRIIVY